MFSNNTMNTTVPPLDQGTANVAGGATGDVLGSTIPEYGGAAGGLIGSFQGGGYLPYAQGGGYLPYAQGIIGVGRGMGR